MSAYDDIHARSLSDPEAFWAEAAEGIHWERRWGPRAGRLAGALLPLVPGGGHEHLLQRPRPGTWRAGRADQLALIYDSPITGVIERFTYRELRDRVARVAGVLAEAGVGRGDRVLVYMPMVPEGGGRDVGLRAAGGPCTRSCSGGSRRASWPYASTTPRRRSCSRPRAASSRGGSWPTSPCSTRAIEIATHKPAHCVILQRPQLEADLVEGRDPRLGGGGGSGGAPPLRLGGGDGPALHPLHLGNDGAAEGDRSRQRRSPGGAQLEHAQRLRGGTGRGVLGGLGRGLGGGAFVHRLRTPDPREHDRAVRGQAGGDTRRGGLLAGYRRARREGAVHGADGLPRYQARGSGGRAYPAGADQGAAGAFPCGGARRSGHGSMGGGAARCARHRPLVADGGRAGRCAPTRRASS